MVNSKVAIIGLGLIGGSLAKALNLRLGIRDITAVDTDRESLRKAVKEGVIKAGFTEPDESVYTSDLIFLCTPVRLSREYIRLLAGKAGKNCIVTDVGSTKGELASFVDSLEDAPCFIGGHPMAGSEKTGYPAASAHLFENAYYILTPCKSSSSKAMETMQEIIRGLGALPVVMEAGEHDRITAAISHVPHIVASALVNMVCETDTEEGMARMLAAGGFRDITRIASSSPAMWESIAFSNRHRINELLDSFERILEEYRAAVNAGDSGRIHTFFTSAKSYRDSIPARAAGLIPPEFVLYADIEDKPGIIGEIATLLGMSNINIKNISVVNSRELEQGCLRIALPDMESTNIGFDLLSVSGYKVYKK